MKLHDLFLLFPHWDGFTVIAVKGSVSVWACQMKVNGESGGVQPPVGLSGHEQWKRWSWNCWNSSLCLSCQCRLKPGTLREAMSSRILTLSSLWPGDTNSACKLFSTSPQQSIEQGWAKWEETLSTHPFDLCPQRWTGGVRPSSDPEIHLSLVATLGPEAEEIKGHRFSSLDLQLSLSKSITKHYKSIWETFFLVSNFFSCWLSNPAGYRVQRG